MSQKATLSSASPKPTEGLTPPLKWAGGKRWLVPHLAPLFQAHQQQHPTSKLIEPFCGGLAVGLGLHPEQALLNDTNPYLINLYQQIQKNGLPITCDFENDEAAYYSIRNAFNDSIKQKTALNKQAKACAEWFYYLNRTGYNGLCRFNQKGLYNVPFGQYKTINYSTDFKSHQGAMASWTFTCGDFEALTDIQPTDWLYADPPYDVPFTTYSAGGFSWDDQERLAKWLSKQPCTVVTSNQATDRILKLYEALGFHIQLLDAPRRIAASGDRTPAKEMLAIKQPC